ncbi:hypothetical protein D9758_011900 [Tetrapyrgos nigripes]|uniref:Glycopeptide n=1 Tax=Tetrapyrgos nigripes TaxID=182062 RepID=A0A8H5CPQ7_9AGAR|nr:hypothetical protein D9758_011900 [Tetrapyrgos nigripes]
MFSFKSLSIVSLAALVASVNAETHTVHFVNNCGFGTPTLVLDGRILSTGADFTINGPLDGAIAFLQTGNCGPNGEGCTLIELELSNNISSCDISLIPPHTFSVSAGIAYTNGCDGASLTCQSATCPEAFHSASETRTGLICTVANVDITITFCA